MFNKLNNFFHTPENINIKLSLVQSKLFHKKKTGKVIGTKLRGPQLEAKLKEIFGY